ncbi:uncharacterized protein DFL_008370 [Arthrobotrys flagrans]|uniref:Uncharacterized protein n=1 Tax=Arthrobotrys flagrans TaxID=97331 RepID=A0A436ZNQ3_ARTFL|nr:hypothetical protein DFL_008370 [Arthrobotrys flagrans]
MTAWYLLGGEEQNTDCDTAGLFLPGFPYAVGSGHADPRGGHNYSHTLHLRLGLVMGRQSRAFRRIVVAWLVRRDPIQSNLIISS